MQVKEQYVTLLQEDANLTCTPKEECQENEKKKENTKQTTMQTNNFPF